MEIAQEDLSAIIRLVCETCDRWDDPCAWREHLLTGACRLLNGHVGIMLADHGGRAEVFGNVSVVAAVGVPNPLRPLVQPAFTQLNHCPYEDVARNLMPGTTNLYRQIVQQGWVTATRREIADESAYHASPMYRNFRRPLDCDDYVVSIRIVDLPRRPEAINIDRPHGAPPFGPREVMLLKILHDQIAPLIGVRLATEEHLCRDGLSRRLRQTLTLLLEGLSEKEVAREMNLSARTVHEYVTALYDHFQVSSRAELLAYFIRRTPQARTVTGRA